MTSQTSQVPAGGTSLAKPARPFLPCAGQLTGGVVSLFVAALAYMFGLGAQAAPLVLVGVLASLIGIGLFCYGLHALLTHVDNFARAQRGIPLR